MVDISIVNGVYKHHKISYLVANYPRLVFVG